MLQLYTGLVTWFATVRERAEEERGATAVEYALMAALIAVVVVLAVTFVGTAAESKFDLTGSAVNSAS
jgi:pilus assembly protein Flp/PilA